MEIRCGMLAAGIHLNGQCEWDIASYLCFVAQVLAITELIGKNQCTMH